MVVCCKPLKIRQTSDEKDMFEGLRNNVSFVKYNVQFSLVTQMQYFVGPLNVGFGPAVLDARSSPQAGRQAAQQASG
jgi:hypothetical protein